MAKCVLVLIIWSTNNPVVPHIPDNWERATQEYQLHEGIINRVEVNKNIQIAGCKDKSIEFLCLQGNTCINRGKSKFYSVQRKLEFQAGTYNKTLPNIKWIVVKMDRTPYIYYQQNPTVLHTDILCVYWVVICVLGLVYSYHHIGNLTQKKIQELLIYTTFTSKCGILSNSELVN